MVNPYEELLDLNTPRWNPTFKQVPSAFHCSIRINEFHPDLPKVNETYNTLIRAYKYARTQGLAYPSNDFILWIHQDIFFAHEWSGSFRNVNVRVGRHLPPEHQHVPTYMKRLEEIAKEDFDNFRMIDWYNAFETIHPFQDGNGRTGAVVIAIFNKLFHPEEKEWLAPNQ